MDLDQHARVATSSDHVRELIRNDQDRQRLRGLLLAGAASAPTGPIDRTYFDGLRGRVGGGTELYSEGQTPTDVAGGHELDVA